MIRQVKISIPMGRIRLAGTYSVPGSGSFPVPAILMLHGGGASTKDRFRAFQSYAEGQGYASLAIDFRGVGESGGIRQKSSIRQRITDAAAALIYLKSQKSTDPNRICVVGASMGGHVAARLTDKFPDISALILISAAAYSAGAERIPFTVALTRTLRETANWDDSPAFQALSEYRGKVLTIYGSDDRIIPGQIQDRYNDIAAAGGKAAVIEGATHIMLHPVNQNQTRHLKQLLHLSGLFLNQVFGVK